MTGARIPHVGYATVDGLRIRYADTGRPHRRSLLLTSPWPESLHGFARIWSTLAEQARVFAVDLPGFGMSEGRADLQSPPAMGAFLAKLIVEASLGVPHVVAPDVGTSAALWAAAQHPDRVASLLVGTGAIAVPFQLGEPFASWALEPELDKYHRLDHRVLLAAALDLIARRVPEDIVADYLACYAGDRFLDSLRYVRNCTQALPALAELLPRVAAPVTIVTGRHGQGRSIGDATYLHERLANSHVVAIDAGHFVWEERPWEFAAAIVDSIRAAAPFEIAA